MGKIRRRNYVFVTCVGDHGPRHVHVYKDGQFVLKWDLENAKVMKGKATPSLIKLIKQLQSEGQL